MTPTTSCSELIPARARYQRSGTATLLLASAVIALAGCGTTKPSETDTGVYDNTSQIGSPAVYARIDATMSCSKLQGEFDRAMDNADARQPGDSLRDVSLAYARYADNRMSDLGCYG